MSLKPTTTDIIIEEMEQVSTMLGHPDALISDNCTQFTSNNFELYLQTHNIEHLLIAHRKAAKLRDLTVLS